VNQTPGDEPQSQPEPWLADALDELRPAPPRPELRATLRAQFLGAEASAAPADEPVRPAQPARAPRSARQRAPASARPALRLRNLALAALATAAAIAALVFVRTAATPRVDLVACSVSDLTLDGVRVAADALEERLLAGAIVRSAESSVRLRLDNVALIELAPHTELTLRPWSASGEGEARLVLTRGGVRVVTAPEFAPRRLTVAAPQAEVAVVGTEFGVDVVEGMGTCVCCTHGSVAVRALGREGVETLAAGQMSFCFSSRAEPMRGPVKDDHSAAVIALRRFDWPATKSSR
jgi:ferric-dicitrate binding protein FerR (iron transport regulator)